MPRKRSSWFLSKRYRPARWGKWPFWVLLGLELPMTVALLALFGIATPNTYRNRLWQDGADNGFNSSPVTGLYAAANYRPYTTPRVWSQFLTNFNLVIIVLSTFFMIVKSSMYVVNVWPPILSAFIHGAVLALFVTSVYFQAGSDTSDPAQPQNGPPWYITKSCSVAHNPDNIGYCKQAKSAFAVSVCMMTVFLVYFGIAAWSCFPSKAQRDEVALARKERDDKYANLEAMHEEAKAANPEFYGLPPETPGLQSGMNPMTPRTQAFNKLGGTKDLPLRSLFSSPRPNSPTYKLNTPAFPKSPMNLGFDRQQQHPPTSTSPRPQSISPSEAPGSQSPQPGDAMYFPPPPKKATKATK